MKRESVGDGIAWKSTGKIPGHGFVRGQRTYGHSRGLTPWGSLCPEELCPREQGLSFLDCAAGS